MTPQELKISILQRAIQGKLVPQLPEEGTGEELFQQIQEEKQRSIKAGKIKKEKPLPKIAEDEIPFDIPESWKWVRFSDVLDVRDGTHDTPKYVTSGIPLVTSKNLVDGGIDFETTKLISIEDAQAINMRSAVNDGDILFAMIGTIGNPVLVKKDREFCIKNMALFKAINQELISMEYLFLFLQNEQHVMKKKASGGVQSFVSLKFLRNYLLPLPPAAEQKRIVAKIEEWLPLIDRYEQAWSKLEEFNKRFPVDMQKSILQMAIQGKLVPQLPEEGTGEELFQQIQEEKQRSIKAGTIKKEKPLPEIAEDEIPFDIPESWKWVRLSQLFSVLNGDRGKNYPAKSTLSHEGIPFISALNLDGKSVIEDDNLLCLSEQQYEKLGNGKLIRDDIVVCIRGSLGKHGRYPFDKGAIASSLVILRAFTNDDVLAEFLMMYLDTPLFFSEIRRYDNGTAQPNLAAKSLEQFLVPLPPLAEQKRIVTKLEEILPLCERLK